MARRPPDHSKDAGGDQSVLAAKTALRHEAWEAVRAAGVARFPGAVGRIPNFIGAEAAAESLRATPEWARAATVKANPDSPQLPVRQRALEDAKTLYMAVPRLASAAPFIALDPATLPVRPRQAASIGGSARHGRPVAIADMAPVDLVVTGCVAVSPDGARLGKGGGFSDLEFALACEAGLIGRTTVVCTTVADAQVLDDDRIPVTAHDMWLDLIVTPTRVLRCPRRPRRGTIRWSELTAEKVASIPLLAALREQLGDGPPVARR